MLDFHQYLLQCKYLDWLNMLLILLNLYLGEVLL